MACWLPSIELVPALQKEVYFIEIVVLVKKIPKNLALPSITKVFIKQIYNKSYLLFTLNRLSPILQCVSLKIKLILLKKTNHEFRKAWVLFVVPSRYE